MFKTLFCVTPSPMLITEIKDGTILAANISLLNTSGYTEEELIGKSVIILYKNPEDREKVIKSIMEKGFVKDIEILFKTKSGTTLKCLLSVKPLTTGTLSVFISAVITL